MEKLSYNRDKAVDYAHTWALSRNPAYYDYAKIGGDCTNFVSQCLFAGVGVMNYDRALGWYYKNANVKSPSWTGVQFLYDFLTRSKETPGPLAAPVDETDVLPGDIAQLSFDGARFSHTLVIVDVGKKGGLLIAAHDFDCDYRAIDTYEYKLVRLLHITRVISDIR